MKALLFPKPYILRNRKRGVKKYKNTFSAEKSKRLPLPHMKLSYI